MSIEETGRLSYSPFIALAGALILSAAYCGSSQGQIKPASYGQGQGQLKQFKQDPGILNEFKIKLKIGGDRLSVIKQAVDRRSNFLYDYYFVTILSNKYSSKIGSGVGLAGVAAALPAVGIAGAGIIIIDVGIGLYSDFYDNTSQYLDKLRAISDLWIKERSKYMRLLRTRALTADDLNEMEKDLEIQLAEIRKIQKELKFHRFTHVDLSSI